MNHDGQFINFFVRNVILRSPRVECHVTSVSRDIVPQNHLYSWHGHWSPWVPSPYRGSRVINTLGDYRDMGSATPDSTTDTILGLAVSSHRALVTPNLSIYRELIPFYNCLSVSFPLRTRVCPNFILFYNKSPKFNLTLLLLYFVYLGTVTPSVEMSSYHRTYSLLSLAISPTCHS